MLGPLSRLLERLAEISEGGPTLWCGERPDVPLHDVPRTIAAAVGYPTNPRHEFPFETMEKIDLESAAREMAYCAGGLAYHSDLPDIERELAEIRAGLLALSDATFLTNGVRHEFGWSGNAMTAATMDAGVMGFDERYAFIFWVEDED